MEIWKTSITQPDILCFISQTIFSSVYFLCCYSTTRYKSSTTFLFISLSYFHFKFRSKHQSTTVLLSLWAQTFFPCHLHTSKAPSMLLGVLACSPPTPHAPGMLRPHPHTHALPEPRQACLVTQGTGTQWNGILKGCKQIMFNISQFSRPLRQVRRFLRVLMRRDNCSADWIFNFQPKA